MSFSVLLTIISDSGSFNPQLIWYITLSAVAARPGQSHGFSLDSDEIEGEDSRERKEKPDEAQRASWERRTPADDKRRRREDSEPRLFMPCDDNQDAQEPSEATDKCGTFLMWSASACMLFETLISKTTHRLCFYVIQPSRFAVWISSTSKIGTKMIFFSPPSYVDKGQATLSLGMDLNLDWMTLDDFQKHLNGEDEILSGPPLSPSRFSIKAGFR